MVDGGPDPGEIADRRRGPLPRGQRQVVSTLVLGDVAVSRHGHPPGGVTDVGRGAAVNGCDIQGRT